MRALALLLALAGCASAQGWPAMNTIGQKPFGVLLLGEGGNRDWQTQLDMIRKKAGERYPLEFAAGEADWREMQRGIDALLDDKVRTIVVVPLFVSSYNDVMDQVRFLLGIREKPSKALLDAPHSHEGAPPQRLRSRAPIVLANALDDSPLFVDLLTSRAKMQSRHPEQEAVILVGESAPPELADKVRQKGGFAAARAYAYHAGPMQSDRERSDAGLVALAKELGRTYKVIVVPLSMTGGMRLNEALDGLFVKYDGRAILPDERIAQWVDQSATEAAKLPDMRLFKDAGNAGLLPPALAFPALTQPSMTAPPALPRQGEKNNE